MSEIPPPNPYAASQPVDGPQRPYVPSDTDNTGGLIPYKNPHALIAYYLGLFSLFPCIGLLLAIPAFILGIMGYRRYKANPIIHGSVHAWIGIIMGGTMTLIWSALLILSTLTLMFAK